MSVLNILNYPDERLHTIASPVETVDEPVRQLIRDLAETMYTAPGVGLAATQVDVHRRIIVIDISQTRDELLVLVNPEIMTRDGVQECEEGCLSVPGVYEKVTRAQNIRFTALGADGARFERAAQGLLAVCIQHEMDHLQGKVFVDYLSRLKRARIRSRMQKRERQIA